MGKERNIFASNVGRYIKNATDQRFAFAQAKAIWDKATHRLLTA